MSGACIWCTNGDDIPDEEDKARDGYNPDEFLGLVMSFDTGKLHMRCRQPFREYKEDVQSKQFGWWLFEEQRGSDLGGVTEIVPVIVRARSHLEAYFVASRSFGVMFFGPEEFEECIKDYMWAASDGSSVCYEVRKLKLPDGVRRV